MSGDTALLFEIVPRLAPGELLFSVLVFAAAICVLFNIRAVAILGALLLLTIITFVDLLGASPYFAILVLLTAAFLRLLATAAGGLDDTDPELVAVLASIIGRATDDQDDD